MLALPAALPGLVRLLVPALPPVDALAPALALDPPELAAPAPSNEARSASAELPHAGKQAANSRGESSEERAIIRSERPDVKGKPYSGAGIGLWPQPITAGLVLRVVNSGAVSHP